MKTILTHNVFKQIAGILIIGCALTILFGEGAHLHAVFDHFNDHNNDVHTLFHAHSDDKGSDAESEEHQHEVSSIDIYGILASGVKADVIIDATSNLFISTAIIFAEFDDQPNYLFDLPPPDKSFNQYHSFSFSLRGPPLA